MTLKRGVFEHKGKLVISSLDGARTVYTNHQDFVCKILSIEKQLDENFCKKNLIRTEHRAKKNPVYLLTRKGCKAIAEKLSAEKRLAFEQRCKELFNPTHTEARPEEKSLEPYVPQSTADFGVFEKDGKAVVSSRTVAKVFGKLHAHVLRDINGLTCSPLFNQSNFGFVEYSDTKGETRPECLMTRDGFMFLVMGYTGETAAAIKEGYINVFNTMEARLKQVTNNSVLDLNNPIETAKLIHKLSGDFLKGQETISRLQVTNFELEAKIEADAPKVQLAESFIASKDEKESSVYAQFLIQAGIKQLLVNGKAVQMGRNNFIKWLLENKYVSRADDGVKIIGFRPIGIAKTREFITIHHKKINPIKKYHLEIYITAVGQLYFVKKIMQQLAETNQLISLTSGGLRLLSFADQLVDESVEYVKENEEQ